MLVIGSRRILKLVNAKGRVRMEKNGRGGRGVVNEKKPKKKKKKPQSLYLEKSCKMLLRRKKYLGVRFERRKVFLRLN